MTVVFQIDISAEEESLKTVLELSPNSINNNDRLDILQSAYINQRLTGITASFIKVLYNSIWSHKYVVVKTENLISLIGQVLICNIDTTDFLISFCRHLSMSLKQYQLG